MGDVPPFIPAGLHESIRNLLPEWKDVSGYEGCYRVSSLGEVESLERFVVSKKGRVQKIKGRILIAHPDTDGYPQVILCKDGETKCRKVHRLVAEAFIPNPNNKPMINHKDWDKSNAKVSNLEWATHKENEKHAILNGLKAKGSDFKTAKLKEEYVPTIRRRLHRGDTVAEVARHYGVHWSIIDGIKKGKLWKHVA